MKKIFSFMLVLTLLTLSLSAWDKDFTYLENYKWKVLYKCYDDGCDWYWKHCSTVCFNVDGFIYNEGNEFKIGIWYEFPENQLSILFYDRGGGLNGQIFYLDFPTVAMEGMGYSYNGSKMKFVKIFMAREDPIK